LSIMSNDRATYFPTLSPFPNGMAWGHSMAWGQA
jgi:hypothetical protein